MWNLVDTMWHHVRTMRDNVQTSNERSAFVVTEQEDREEIFVKAITSEKPSGRIFSSSSGGALYLQFSLTYWLPPSLSQIFALALYLSILEFWAPVWHPGLLRTLVDWRGSRKWPWLWYLAQHTNYHSYSNALAELNLLNLSDRRESLCLSFALKCEKTLQKTPGIPAHTSQSGLEQKDLRTCLYPTSHTYSISTIK